MLIPFEITLRGSVERDNILKHESRDLINLFDQTVERQFGSTMRVFIPDEGPLYACAYGDNRDDKFKFFGVFTGTGRLPDWAETITIVKSSCGDILHFVSIKADDINEANGLMLSHMYEEELDMGSAVTFNGNEISNIPVINRPSYFLVNNYGNESYVTILEPVDDFKRTPERAVLASAYKSVAQLIGAFKEKVPDNANKAYKRKDTVEVFFMGFRWVWRPEHTSFYGTISAGYELLPLIARWAVLTGALSGIDNKDPAYLPIKYWSGTARGFGNIQLNQKMIEVPTESGKEVRFENKLVPILYSLAGNVARAAMLNIIPKEAYDLYDKIMGKMFNGMERTKYGTNNGYIVQWTDGTGAKKFISAVYGSGTLPEWAEEIAKETDANITVTVISIKAGTVDEAQSRVKELLND